MKVVMEKNRETFPHIPDESSKLRNFSPSKLLSFMVFVPNLMHAYTQVIVILQSVQKKEFTQKTA